MADSVLTVVGGRMVLSKGTLNPLKSLKSIHAYLLLMYLLSKNLVSLYCSEVPPVEPLELPPDRPAGDDAAGPADQQDDGPQHPGHPGPQDGDPRGPGAAQSSRPGAQ